MFKNTPKEIEDLMWAGKTDDLRKEFPCKCCCEEHTFADCPARYWGGCRSNLPPNEE
jgi:hypothetical protein